ncbi:hypothetical protein [Nocardioides insulae]|uniref:aromatic-ring hydroxylase C-terminal domain-containing protein n=1 Tax=Nocardioides insulae TaxID=394734 RepID=UPI0004276940|nr:hypothetical protein [Nocardioides insulae]
MKRGDQERQLTLSYRRGPLALGVPDDATGVQAGDRAPNVDWSDPETGPQRLIDHLRGPHFTLLALGDAAIDGLSEATSQWPEAGAALHPVAVPTTAAAHLAQAYGTTVSAQILIRPDGYLAYAANGDWAGAMADFTSLAGPA